MRISLIFLFAFIQLLHTYSQPVITDSVIPVHEDQLYYEELRFTSTFHQAPSGQNVVWDFSNIPLKQNSYHQQWTDPGPKPGSQLFPSSNLYVNGRQGSGSFLMRSHSGLVYLGNYREPDSYTSFASDPEILLPIPMAYNYKVVDSFAGVSINSQDTFDLVGNVSIHADGYGTLKLKNATHHNVLRIFYDKYLAWFDDGQLILEEFYEQYKYYKNGSKNYLLSHYHVLIVDPALGVMANGLYGEYRDSLYIFTEDIDLNRSEIEIYPNPTKGQLYVNFHSYYGQATIEIFDGSGKLMLMNEVTVDSEIVLDINRNSGLYLVKVSFPNGDYIVRRILKE